ncbi:MULTISPECIES: DUF4870 domain-containing protein [unclassified Agrococcus]|uniref:DUF4870 domain-containing protein n=1 Tax=unclassified Agrococcus TaxID=2615065 RepID=UPI00360A2C6F
MTDPHGPATPEEPQAPRFGAPQAGDASQAAPAPGEPAQPFSSPAPGAAHHAPEAPQAPFGAPGQHGQQPPAAPPYGAPGQQHAQQPPAAPPYGAPGQQVPPQQPYGAPQYGAPGQPQYPAGAPMSPQDEKQWAMLGHLGGIAWVLSLGWLGPLIVFLMYKDRSAFVRQESKEALNFQLFMTILFVGLVLVGSITSFILIGFVFLAVCWVPPLLGLIFAIVGAVRVNAGGSYRYPFNWRIIK